jgi:hypothetical protein
MGRRRKPKARRSGGRKRRRLGELLRAAPAAGAALFFSHPINLGSLTDSLRSSVSRRGGDSLRSSVSRRGGDSLRSCLAGAGTHFVRPLPSGYDHHRALAAAFDRQGRHELPLGARLLSDPVARQSRGRRSERDRLPPVGRGRVRDLFLHPALQRRAAALEPRRARPPVAERADEEPRQVAADHPLESNAGARPPVGVLEIDDLLEQERDPARVMRSCGSLHGTEDIGRGRSVLSPWDGSKALRQADERSESVRDP